MDALTIAGSLKDRLDAVHAPFQVPPPLQPAAVVAILVCTPEVDDPDDPRLVLIERSVSLRSHGGQLAFPGGKPEHNDRDLVDTALREAEEEVGLERDQLAVVGRLEPVPTPSGFMIAPFVGTIEGTWQPRIRSPEVTRILMPRLSTLSDPAIHRITGTRVWRGRRYELHEYAIHDPPLWGATARMVWDLLKRLPP